LLAAGQHTQLAAQIDAGLVSHAVLAIGQNDFAPGREAYLSIATEVWTTEQIEEYSDQVVNSVEEALVQLYNTNARLVVSNIVDYGVSPAIRDSFTVEERERVTTVIQAINRRLRTLANQYNTPLVDMNGMLQSILGLTTAPKASLQIGGVTIANAADSSPTNAFVDDGIHLHTVVQAQVANLICTAVDLA
jgi:lysophospholipase L1-like esterase